MGGNIVGYNYTAIIPARGGSVRLPGKNLALVGGITLVGRAIKAAQAVPRIVRIVVSTDGRAIADEARAQGAAVVIRPDHLSHGDLPGPWPMLKHCIDTLELRDEAVRVGYVVLLQPTSPLRDAGDINGALDAFEAGDCDSVTTVAPDGTENGAVYVFHRQLLEQDTIYGKRIRKYPMAAEHSVDVDTQEDLERANELEGERHGNTGRSMHELGGHQRRTRSDKGKPRLRRGPDEVPAVQC